MIKGRQCQCSATHRLTIQYRVCLYATVSQETPIIIYVLLVDAVMMAPNSNSNLTRAEPPLLLYSPVLFTSLRGGRVHLSAQNKPIQTRVDTPCLIIILYHSQ